MESSVAMVSSATATGQPEEAIKQEPPALLATVTSKWLLSNKRCAMPLIVGSNAGVSGVCVPTVAATLEYDNRRRVSLPAVFVPRLGMPPAEGGAEGNVRSDARAWLASNGNDKAAGSSWLASNWR